MDAPSPTVLVPVDVGVPLRIPALVLKLSQEGQLVAVQVGETKVEVIW